MQCRRNTNCPEGLLPFGTSPTETARNAIYRTETGSVHLRGYPGRFRVSRYAVRHSMGSEHETTTRCKETSVPAEVIEMTVGKSARASLLESIENDLDEQIRFELDAIEVLMEDLRELAIQFPDNPLPIDRMNKLRYLQERLRRLLKPRSERINSHETVN